eukprot:Tamp_24056.p2 GENE.Tamp_24056~~Tamp_24056.p2  ORF type:complete len:169 (-),score=36.45 Tamp_24056:157-663(-)
MSTECQASVLTYGTIVAFIFYNIGWWACWVGEFMRQDEAEDREKSIVFTGKHYLGEEGEMIEMVLIARKDLDMPTGMLATQSCHAGVALFKKARVKYAGLIKAWEECGSRKLLLHVPDEPALQRAQQALKSKGLPTTFIRDKKEVKKKERKKRKKRCKEQRLAHHIYP